MLSLSRFYVTVTGRVSPEVGLPSPTSLSPTLKALFNMAFYTLDLLLLSSTIFGKSVMVEFMVKAPPLKVSLA